MPASWMPLAPLFWAYCEDLRLLGGHVDHLGQHRLMAVDDDVDVVLFEDAQVDFAGHRHRAAEDDVLEVGGDHGPAPTVGQGGAAALLDDVVVVLVHAHVGAVHQFDDLDVAAPGHDAVFPPQFQAFLGGPLGVGELAVLLAELQQNFIGHFQGDGFFGAGLGILALALGGGHVPILGEPVQLGHVFELVALGLSQGHFLEQLGHAPGMVVVGGGPGADHAGEVPGHDGLGGGAAQARALLLLFAGLAFLLLGGRHPAGTLGADAAAGAFSADGAGLHGRGPVPNGLDPVRLGLLQHLLGRGVNR